MIRVVLLLTSFTFALQSYSQAYKTFEIVKGQKLTGVVRAADMPTKVSTFSLLAPGKGAQFYTPDSLVRASKKVVRFHARTEEYAHGEILFVNLITKNQEIFPAKAPLVSVYYNADSATNSWKRFNYNHTTLLPNHVLSVEIDTSHTDLYIVLVFPQSFTGKFKFELTSKVKPGVPPINRKPGFNGKLYFHPYDYVKKPLPFMEAIIFSKQKEWIQGSIKLDNPAFEEPSITPGTDSLFFNELMSNILTIRKEGKFYWHDDYPRVLFQMKFDQEGRLLGVQLSLFGPTYDKEEEILSNLELIRQCVPKHFTWRAAKNMYGQNIDYTREFLLHLDFYWN